MLCVHLQYIYCTENVEVLNCIFPTPSGVKRKGQLTTNLYNLEKARTPLMESKRHEMRWSSGNSRDVALVI